MRDVIPEPVYERIRVHLERVGNRAESGWDAGSSEEDTLTGHLGAQLQRAWSRKVRVGQVDWRWRVRYKKFRGRGAKPLENLSGADGIVQIEVTRPDATVLTKGIIFQAKKGDVRRSKRLLEQVEIMEELAQGSSGVFFYRPEGYRALCGASLLDVVGRRSVFSRYESTLPLGTYLAERFLACETGQRDMYFDAVRDLLILPAQAEVTAVRAALVDRLLVEVQAAP